MIDQSIILLADSYYSFLTYSNSEYVQFSREMYPLLLPKHTKFPKIETKSICADKIILYSIT